MNKDILKQQLMDVNIPINDNTKAYLTIMAILDKDEFPDYFKVEFSREILRKLDTKSNNIGSYEKVKSKIEEAKKRWK